MTKAGESLKSDTTRIVGWCLYDFANSAFNTVIITFIFSVYFGRAVVGDETQGAAYWGYAISLSAICVAILAPVLGGAADMTGRYKRPLIVVTLLCLVATSGLWLAVPLMDAGGIIMVLALVVLANIAFEMGQIYYNAMLPAIAPSTHTGRISGWGWGMGYIGGLLCLALVLWLLVGLGDVKPLLSLPTENAENMRAVALCAALWFFVFSLPLFITYQDKTDRTVSFAIALRHSVGMLRDMVQHLKGHGNFIRFLIASALYRDGLVTLFAIGGLYAAGVYQMGFTDILIFAIGLNITAGIGALGFSFLDDKIGSKHTIMLALAGLIVIGICVLVTEQKQIFMILSLALGVFIGPVQAASRTLAARLSPDGAEGQYFGLYAMTGKSVAFLGPLGFALATDIFNTQKAGLFVILLFWLGGFIILRKVQDSTT